MISVPVGRRIYVVWWLGSRGCLRQWRWGRTGTNWPTYYLGILKVGQGPR